MGVDEEGEARVSGVSGGGWKGEAVRFGGV